MNLDDIIWNASCCGDHAEWAEIETSSGWLRIKRNPEAMTYLVTRYDKGQRLIAAEAPIDADALQAMLG